MLKKADILRILGEYGFSKDEYWVMTGAALVLQGVREETRDIDLGVTRGLFERLKAQGHASLTDKDGDRKIELDEYTEIFPEWRAQALETIEGVPCATLESTMRIKTQLGREKDLRDIERIRAFLEKSGR